MLWQFFLGRFLQMAAAVGAVLTVVDWLRLGGPHVRAGRILAWSAMLGAAAASVAVWRARRLPRSR